MCHEPRLFDFSKVLRAPRLRCFGSQVCGFGLLSVLAGVFSLRLLGVCVWLGTVWFFGVGVGWGERWLFYVPTELLSPKFGSVGLGFLSLRVLRVPAQLYALRIVGRYLLIRCSWLHCVDPGLCTYGILNVRAQLRSARVRDFGLGRYISWVLLVPAIHGTFRCIAVGLALASYWIIFVAAVVRPTRLHCFGLWTGQIGVLCLSLECSTSGFQPVATKLCASKLVPLGVTIRTPGGIAVLAHLLAHWLLCVCFWAGCARLLAVTFGFFAAGLFSVAA